VTLPSTVELWLVRHGLTPWNAAHRLQGWADVPLATEGEAQARALWSRLGAAEFDSVWCSDLARARETARLAHGPARPDARLRELHFGGLEGCLFADLPTDVRDALVAFEGFAAPKGESVADLRRRVLDLVDELAPGRHVIFTHGGVVRVLLAELGARLYVGPASLAIVDWSARRLVALEPTPTVEPPGGVDP
jgi:probable phosphoglycerate mutase